jgi:hypothetical protein
VKGRVSGAPTITVTRNEILYSLDKPEDFGVTSVSYDFPELLRRAQEPT